MHSLCGAVGGANTLQYSNGYVNVTGAHYRVVEHTQNREHCAAACAADTPCVAWTRVAAGRPDVQSCYLKASIADLATSARRGTVSLDAQSTSTLLGFSSCIVKAAARCEEACRTK